MKPPKYHRIFNYRKSLLPNDYLSTLEKDTHDIEDAMKKTGLSIGYPGWNLIYYAAMSNLDTQGENIILETGTNFGCSTIMLAQALKDSGQKGHVYSVELDNSNYNKARDNISNAGLSEFVSLYCEDSIDFIKDFVKKVTNIRIAFLDGCHDKDHVVNEFELTYPKLSDESMVFFDNTYKIADEGEDQRVNGALKIIKDRVGGNLLNFENVSWYTPGIAIWQKDGLRKDWV